MGLKSGVQARSDATHALEVLIAVPYPSLDFVRHTPIRRKAVRSEPRTCTLTLSLTLGPDLTLTVTLTLTLTLTLILTLTLSLTLTLTLTLSTGPQLRRTTKVFLEEAPESIRKRWTVGWLPLTHATATAEMPPTLSMSLDGDQGYRLKPPSH